MKLYKSFATLMLASLVGGASEANAQATADSLVQVAFGTQAKEDILGGVSSINVSELMKKDYYTSSLGELSGLVGGYNGSVWGQGALVIVDGSPREASYVNPSQIESVTILKAASAVALYGSKGAKGVILITTKRGKVQPLHIDVRANTGLYVAKRYPKYLGAAEYMTLYNEAYANDHPDAAELYYDAATIYNTAAGTNPVRYPDMNLYSSDYIRKAYNRTDATVEISGGTEKARYYANFGALYLGSQVKYGDKKNDNDLNFNIRANVDMNITSWLKGYTNAAVNLEDNYRARGEFWDAAANLRPNWYSALLPISMMDMNNASIRAMVENSNNIIDGQYLLGGNNANQSTVYGDMLKAGYIKGKNRTFLFDVGLTADLSALTQGLTVTAAYSLDYWNNYNEAWKEQYATYQPTWANMNGQDIIIGLTKYSQDKRTNNSEYVGQSYDTQTMSARLQFDYNRTFGNVHNVAATLMGWGYQQQASRDDGHQSSDYHRVSNLNLGLRVNYNFAQKYYAEAAASLVHSAKLAEGHRNALSPSLTLGWRLGKEKFMQNSFVDDLKLSASYSVLNQDIDLDSWYMYQGSYNMKGTWYQWQDGSQGGYATTSERGANENLGYIKRKEWRVSLDGSLWNNLITFDLNYFNQLTDGLVTNGSSTIYPTFFTGRGSFLPNTNYNADKRSGFDFDVKLNKKLGQVDASLGLVGMYYTTKADKRDEVWGNSYQYRAGKSLSAAWGYECEGFFTSESDIANHATQTFGEVKPGDLKYKDQNGDGVIDSKDQVDLGQYSAPFFYGVNLTLKWKNFTFFALATGQAGAIGFKNNTYYCPRGDSKYSAYARDRWTPETASTAKYPRLTTTSNSNNLQTSDFWKYSTNRFDLSKIQVTYDMPEEWFAGKVVKGMSVYLSGESLLTISGERELMETNIGSAPQNRFYNLGVKVNL